MADQFDLVDNVLQDMEQNNSPQVLQYQPNFQDQQSQGGMRSPGGIGGYGPGGGHSAGQQMHPGMNQGNYGGQQMPPEMAMGEYDYDDQAQMPQQRQQMQAMREIPMEQYAPDFDQMSEGQRHQISQEEMTVPDLRSFGQEETENGWMDDMFGEIKGPLIIVALAFAMSLPQVNAVIRNVIVRFTTNPMYMNMSMAILLGALFYIVKRLLD